MTEVTDARAILADYQWNGRPTGTPTPVFISYSFETSAPDYVAPFGGYPAEFRDSFRPLADAHRQTARLAFQRWDDASGIRFFEVPAGMGGIKLGMYDLALRGLDYANTEGLFEGRFSPTGYAPRTSVMINDGASANDVSLYLHEIGHGLGLKHPFDGDFTLTPALDDASFTVMSYDGHSNILGPLDRDAVVQRYGTGADDGQHLAAWSWDASSVTLRQDGRDVGERLFGIGGNNVIFGNGGEDYLEGADGADVLVGGSGADALFGFDGNDHLYGQSANGGSDGADLLRGGAGGDYLQGNAGADVLLGEAGSDRIFGGADGDTINGGDGNDTVNGNLGDDGIDGGAGNDWLRGGQGNDQLAGSGGDDWLIGDLGADTLDGGGGNDFLTGGDGADVFRTYGLNFDPFGGAGIPNPYQPTVMPATTVVLDYADGQDRIAFGFSFTGSIFRGSAATAEAASASALQQLVASRNVAAIAVGGDTLLFIGNGPTGSIGSIAVRNTAPSQFDASDFI